MPFLDSLDIGNRALAHLGASPIETIDEDSKANQIITFLYDTEREAELRANIWRYATRRAFLRAIDTTTMLLAPRAWKATTTYLPGAIVADDNGTLWHSLEPDNLDNEPGVTTVWDEYFGPLTVSLYDSDTTYESGELVYKASGNTGGFVVFRSLSNTNTSVPTTADAWVSATQYNLNQVVSYSGSQWRSLIAFNVGITPAEGPIDFNTSSTYSASQTATGSNGFIYSSIAGGNIGNDPVTTTGYWTNTGVARAWTAVPTLFPSATSWVPLYAGLSNLMILYPAGAGPASQVTTRNIFRIPNGYMREAPNDPKNPMQGFSDRTFEGDYFVSTDTITLFRFVANVRNVPSMDPLFHEALAARIALGACEPITQSSEKLRSVGAVYNTFLDRANLANAIEIGYTEPALDDYLSVRY